MGSRGADQGLPLSFLDLFACVASDFPDLHEHPASCSLRGLPAPRRAPPRGILCTRVMRRSQASLEYKVDLETMMRRRESYVLDFEECDPLRVKYLTRPAMRRRPPGTFSSFSPVSAFCGGARVLRAPAITSNYFLSSRSHYPLISTAMPLAKAPTVFCSGGSRGIGLAVAVKLAQAVSEVQDW